MIMEMDFCRPYLECNLKLIKNVKGKLKANNFNLVKEKQTYWLNTIYSWWLLQPIKTPGLILTIKKKTQPTCNEISSVKCYSPANYSEDLMCLISSILEVWSVTEAKVSLWNLSRTCSSGKGEIGFCPCVAYMAWNLLLNWTLKYQILSKILGLVCNNSCLKCHDFSVTSVIFNILTEIWISGRILWQLFGKKLL